MRKKTYSRKGAGQSSVVSQCFASSSSPIKPNSLPPMVLASLSVSRADDSQSKITSPPDSPARNTRNQCKKRAENDSGENAPRNNELQSRNIGDLVEEMSLMALKTKDEVEKTFENGSWGQGKPALSNTILQSKDANAVAGRRPKAKRKVKKSPRTTSSVDALLSEFENLQISAETNLETNVDNNPSLAREKTSTSTTRDRRPKSVQESSIRAKPPKCEITIQPHYSAYAQPLLSLCSDPSGRTAPTPFQTWADDLSQFFNINKIAEASYGEVYRLSLRSSDLGLSSEEESVLKLIALKPPPGRALSDGTNSSGTKEKPRESKKSLAMSSVQDVASEVRLLRHLSPIPGFTNFREIRVLQGRLPRQFVAAWKNYNRCIKKSLFPDPSRKASYAEEQLWAVVEMQDAGTDVESLMERLENEGAVSVWVAWDVFWSVACAVAKGEEWTGFEHRDLHMGNICVRLTGSDAGSILNPDPTSLNLSTTISYTGLETTLIDYTLSRATMNDIDDVAFFDLSKDPAIFEGDGEEDYQYDMYRAMRSAVLHGNPAAATSEEEESDAGEKVWRKSHPMTNLVWLHFVLFKLMERVSEDVVGSRKESQEICSLGIELRRRLQCLQKELELQSLAAGDLKRTADLIAWAVDLGWLDEADVVGLNGNEKSELKLEDRERLTRNGPSLTRS